jgi:hypothetical protein
MPGEGLRHASGETTDMRFILGFFAAMLAVLLVHQPIVHFLVGLGWIPGRAYNMGAVNTAPAELANFMKSLGFAGWPVLFNSLFWGGLWGGLFGLIHHRLPGGLLLIKGLIYGLLILVFSNWILLPFIRGTLMGLPNNPFFAGFVPNRMLAGAMILGGFGAATGFIYSLLRRD